MITAHSELKTFATCRRKWYFSYYLSYGYEHTPPTGNAQLGTRLHLALESSYGYGLDPLEVLFYLYQQASQESPEEEEKIGKEHDLAAVIIEGFVQWAAEEGFDAGFRVVATEQEVHVSIPFSDSSDSFTLVGKLDQIVQRLEDGALLFRDWKSVGNLGKADGLVRDTQMRTYTMLQSLRAKDDPAVIRTDGGQYVMLVRSKRTPRAKGPFYQVVEFTYNRHDLNATWLRVRTIASQISAVRDALDNGAEHHSVAYPNPGDYCEWACPFSRVCHLADDGSRLQDALAGNYMQVDPMARYRDTAIDRILEHFQPERKE